MSVTQNNAAAPRIATMYAAVGLVWACLFAIALTGYPNLMDNERRVGAYVLDVVQNGHWICQHDAAGQIASKPPLLTWIAALATLPFGHVTRFALYLPSALATLGVAWVILAAGRVRFGWLAGLLGALAYLLSLLADKQVVTARYDGLFAFPVALAALAAFRAWNLGRGWTWFWLAAALATMAKGPLGLVLGAFGLLAALWEWRSGDPLPIRGSHALGVALYLLICGGWFALAYGQLGQPLIDKLIGRELVAHAVKDGDHVLGGGFYEPTFNAFVHFLPWSPFAAIAFWRVWKHPSTDKENRRFERFLVCWFFAGLLIFSVAAHQRGRLIFPLMPAAALLAGRELARRLVSVPTARLFRLAAGVTVIALGLFAIYHHLLLRWSSRTQQTRGMQEMAESVRRQVGAQFPLTHVNSPFAIQICLNTFRPWVSYGQAAQLLRGDAAAFVIVRDPDELRAKLDTNAPPLHELLRWPASGDAFVSIISNHPRLEWTDHMAAAIGPISIRADGARLLHATAEELLFARGTKGDGSVTVANISDQPVKLRVRFTGGKADSVAERLLAPGQTWQL